MWEQFPKVLMRPIYNVGVVARFEKKKPMLVEMIVCHFRRNTLTQISITYVVVVNGYEWK